MALFKKMQQKMESAMTNMAGGDTSLVGTGVLGRAIIVSVTPSGSSIRRGGMPAEYGCVVALEVHLDDTPTYNTQAQCLIPETLLPQIRPGNTFVAVWADPNDGMHVNVDFNTPPPEVRMASNPENLKASDILAQGTPCQAVIIESQPLGMKSPTSGNDMYAFLLTIMAPGTAPYQIQVGNPVPDNAKPLLFPGSKLPAKFMPDMAKENVAIDWEAGIAANS